jgi:ELWxxDGT repeat protein
MQACEPRALLAATLIKDIATGSTPIGETGIQVTVPNGRLFSSAANSVTGSAKLFSTDGTAAGTFQLSAINNPSSLSVVGDKVLFNTLGGDSIDRLCITDGTAAGTVLVKNINTTANPSSISKMTAVGSKVFFSASDASISGSELFVSDGTSAGTKKVQAGLGFDSFYGTNAGGKFLFGGFNRIIQGSQSRVYVTDGNSLTALAAPTIGNDTFYAGSLNGVAYFDGRLTNGGVELFTSNGTTSSLYADINVGAGTNGPVNFVPSSAGMYFLADDGTHGREWFFVTGPRVSAVGVSQGTARPYRTVPLTFNESLGASITKDDVVLRRRKDKRVVAGSYWRFSTFLDNQNRTVVQARVTKDDLQGKYEIVILKESVYGQLGLSNADDIRVKFFLEPVVSGATFSGTPVGGSLLGSDDDASPTPGVAGPVLV